MLPQQVLKRHMVMSLGLLAFSFPTLAQPTYELRVTEIRGGLAKQCLLWALFCKIFFSFPFLVTM